MKNIIWTALAIAIMYFVFFYLFPHFNEKYAGCDLHQKVYNLSIQSLVEKKSIDTLNHSLKKIIYLDENKEEKELELDTEYKNMFKLINVGDSIIKNKRELYFKVRFKATGESEVFKFYTACKDSIK